EHALTGLDGVLVDGQRVTAVLELVFYLDRLARQLAELAHRHEPRTELMGDRAGKDEAPRLDADHDVDPVFGVIGGQHVDYRADRRSILQQGGDVFEEDAFGREILDVADLRPQLGDVHGALW